MTLLREKYPPVGDGTLLSRDDDESAYEAYLAITDAKEKGYLVAVEPESRELDALAAAIGYGIDLQEACDILDLAAEGRDGLTERDQQLYDEAKNEASR